MPSSTPSNEQERLETRSSYRGRDTPPETAFDETTARAALISLTPFPLVTLVERDRQWFTSWYGWEEELLLSAPGPPVEVAESERGSRGRTFHAFLAAATGQAPERASSVA